MSRQRLCPSVAGGFGGQRGWLRKTAGVGQVGEGPLAFDTQRKANQDCDQVACALSVRDISEGVRGCAANTSSLREILRSHRAVGLRAGIYEARMKIPPEKNVV